MWLVLSFLVANTVRLFLCNGKLHLSSTRSVLRSGWFIFTRIVLWLAWTIQCYCGCQVSYLPGADGRCCWSFISNTHWRYWYTAINFVGQWTVANIDQFLMPKMEFFSSGNAHTVSPVPYKRRRKPKNCISGRGGSIWSVKALQNSSMEDRSCAWRQPLWLGGGSHRSPWLFPWVADKTTSISTVLTPLLLPRGPQLGPWHHLSLDPATSTLQLCPRGCLSSVGQTCAYRRQWMAREQINWQCHRYYWMWNWYLKWAKFSDDCLKFLLCLFCISFSGSPPPPVFLRLSNCRTGMLLAAEAAWESPVLEALRSPESHHESRHGSIGNQLLIHQKLDLAKIHQMKQFWVLREKNDFQKYSNQL